MRRIAVLNGPNLDALGWREPDLYGRETYDDLVRRLEERAAALGIRLTFFQSNHEGQLIDRLHEWARDGEWAGLIVNGGGLSHSSVALRDALSLLTCPIVEVHFTNLARREAFRRRSLISGVARGVVSGLGAYGYLAALDYLAQDASRSTSSP